MQTVNIAREHRDIWRDWNRTRRWPRIVDHYFNNPKWRRKTSATSVVRVSWYLAENGSLNTEVDNNGRSDSFGTTYDFADGRVAGYYKPREMGKIAHLISQLPASTKVTDYRDVLMISGRHNGRWIMRMYSRHRMPLAVRRLLWTITPSSLLKD